MAIKIPSKNIYEMNNPKIRDNFIDKVEVNINVVTPNNEENANVYSEKIDSFELEHRQENNEKLESSGYQTSGGGTTVTLGTMGYAEVTNQQIIRKTVLIPISSKNSTIDKLNLGLDEDKNENIKVYIYGNVTSGDASANWKGIYVVDGFNSGFDITKSEVLYGEGTTVEQSYSVPKTIDVSHSGQQYNVNFALDVINVGNLATVNRVFIEKENTEYWQLDLEIFCAFNTLTLVGDYNNGYFNLTGTYNIYNPTSIEVSFYGNTIGISVEESSVTYGNGNKPFSLDGNELLQDSATTNGKLTSQHLADNVLAQYKNGKETATLLCDIGEYYEENGSKVIGIEIQDRMSFHEHDLVIPYVFGADGKDRPMSRYSNGEPKVFEIVSVKRFFDGAVWQELELLEYTPIDNI